MGAYSSPPVPFVTLITSFYKLAYCVSTRRFSDLLDELGVCHQHLRLPPQRTRVSSCRIYAASSRPGSPPRAHNRVSVRPCRRIGSCDARYRIRKGKGIEMSILLSSMRNSSREHAGTRECHQVRTLECICRRGRRYRAGGPGQSVPQHASRSGPRTMVQSLRRGGEKSIRAMGRAKSTCLAT